MTYTTGTSIGDKINQAKINQNNSLTKRALRKHSPLPRPMRMLHLIIIKKVT